MPEQQSTIANGGENSEIPPEVAAYFRCYETIADRLARLVQINRHTLYSLQSGAFKAFLCSVDGNDEDTDDASVHQEWGFYYIEMLQHTIVMLHASMEDVVRTLARWRLPHAPLEKLRDIPILRPDSVGEGKLKELSQLVPHRGMTVDTLIARSVSVWLDHQAFNSTAEVATMLFKMDFPPEKVRPYFSSIDYIARLRHQIAHTGDMPETDLTALSENPDLDQYIQDVYLFARTAFMHVMPCEHEMRFVPFVLLQEELNKRKGLVLVDSLASRYQTEAQQGQGELCPAGEGGSTL